MSTKLDTHVPRQDRTGGDQPENARTAGSRLIDWLWSDSRLGWVLAIFIGIAFGLVSAWLIPRGPVTTPEALLSMAMALLVGVAAGAATGSRGTIVAIPVVFVVVFELGRWGVVGPTVDAINLGSFYGTVAFVLGRIVPGFLVLAPVALGGLLGVWLVTHFGHPDARPLQGPGFTVAGVGVLLVVGLAALIARPASTAPILTTDGQAASVSVAELTTVEIGGHEQVLMIRGRSTESPVLLYLAGGPGGSDIGAMRQDVGLEQDFIVATWDQRGAGKSYPALDPTETFTVDQLVSDTVEVTNYLRDRFDEERVYLVGQSWGSTLGVLAVQERPDLYYALVGVGQMVSQRETDIMFWEDALAWAERTGNVGLAETLRSNGPPPYDDVYDYDGVISYEHEWNAYPGLDLSHEMPGTLFVPEYSWMDRINAFRGFLDTNATLYPQLQEIDFREDVTRLNVPYYMVLGEHEARGRSVLAGEWYEQLDALAKERSVFEGAGHRPNFDDPARFAEFMRGVLEDTQ